MSSNKTLRLWLIILFVTVGVGGAGLSWWLGVDDKIHLQNGADVHSHTSKWDSLKPGTIHKIPRTAKLSLPVEAEFNILKESVVPGEPFTIAVTFHRESLSQQFNYQWRLPKSVRVLSGGTAGAVEFADGETASTMQFVLQQSSSKNEKLTLLLRQAGGNASAKTFRISTLNFHEVKSKSAELMQRQEEYLKLNPEVLRIKK